MKGDDRVSEHGAQGFTDDEIAQGAALVVRRDTEWWPEDPPVPTRALIAAHRARAARIRRWEFRVWAADGTLAGHAHCSIDPDHDDNPDLLQVEVVVESAHRAQGCRYPARRSAPGARHCRRRTRLTSLRTLVAQADEARS